MKAGDEVGSAAWVRDRLRALPPDGNWIDTEPCQELITWLYAVARKRAGHAGVAKRDRIEVAQDAMPAIVSALQRSRDRFATAGNPAAVLERVAMRAVSSGAHRIRMRGFGGVSANGRNWRIPYPRSIGGDVALRLLDDLPDPTHAQCRAIEEAAADIAGWVTHQLGLALTDDAGHAVVYVLERLITGRTRAALVRGGRIGLAADPAMSHLGFDPAGARAFARWLLGRSDPGHERPAVLDAALLGETAHPEVLAAWRLTALEVGFAREQTDAAVMPRAGRPPRTSRHIA